jgi:uncharacterized protein
MTSAQQNLTDNKQQPPVYKMAILTWFAIYPMLNIIFYVLGDTFTGLALLLRTLPVTIILVPVSSYITMPLITRYFNKWLMK